MRYAEMYPPEEGSYHPVGRGTHHVRRHDRSPLSPRQSSTICGLRPRSMAVAQFRVLGGAMARVPVDATAFAHRTSKIMVNIAALYQQPDERATHEAWVNARRGGAATERPAAPTSTSSATRARHACALPIREPRGTGWPRSRRATIPPTSSGSTRTSRRPRVAFADER